MVCVEVGAVVGILGLEGEGGKGFLGVQGLRVLTEGIGKGGEGLVCWW